MQNCRKCSMLSCFSRKFHFFRDIYSIVARCERVNSFYKALKYVFMNTVIKQFLKNGGVARWNRVRNDEIRRMARTRFKVCLTLGAFHWIASHSTPGPRPETKAGWKFCACWRRRRRC